MSKTFKFLIIFLISFTGWWGINLVQKDLESFFYWHEFSQNPQVFLAQININSEARRISIPEIKNLLETQDLEIEAKSAISVLITSKGNKKILFKKDISTRRPIASLTKLMTALIAQEIYEQDQILKITK